MSRSISSTRSGNLVFPDSCVCRRTTVHFSSCVYCVCEHQLFRIALHDQDPRARCPSAWDNIATTWSLTPLCTVVDNWRALRPTSADCSNCSYCFDMVKHMSLTTVVSEFALCCFYVARIVNCNAEDELACWYSGFFCIDGNQELTAYSSAVPFITPIVRKLCGETTVLYFWFWKQSYVNSWPLFVYFH